MEINPFLPACALALCGVLFYFIAVDGQAKNAPGPAPHFLLGHVLKMPTVKIWRYFEKMAALYGPVVRFSLAGQEMIVLNNPRDAEELLSRRSHNYSSRPPSIFAGKYQSNNKRLVLLPYGDTLRKQRAAFHQMLQPRVVGAYGKIQELESVRLLYDMLTTPANLERHCKRFAASLVYTLAYGRRLAADDDLEAVVTILRNFTPETLPGAHLVDSLPILDLLPDAMSPWRKAARGRHEMEMKVYKRLVFDVKSRMESGDVGLECFAARLWDQKEKMDLDLEDLAYIAGTAFEAGTDTTACTMLWFIEAMLLYPECMQRAQAEIDTLLGARADCIPCFEHLPDLPYTVALVKELLRWAPAAPSGFPHYSEADDVYKGFTIKAKSIIIPCVWTMHHNEAEFPDPYQFQPERFLTTKLEGNSDTDLFTSGHYGFGFGRRKCPGRHLAGRTVWIGVVRLLWAFDFAQDVDKDGTPVPVDTNHCTSGMTVQPLDVRARISVRSVKHADAIKSLSQDVVQA